MTALYTSDEPPKNGANAAESQAEEPIGTPSPAVYIPAGDEAPKPKRKPRSAGARARAKGAAWQAELAKHWRDTGLYPDAASTQGAQTRSGRRIGKTPPDVEGTPWWVEAKHTRASNPVGALRQAETERRKAGDARPSIAVVKPNGDKLVGPIVSMRLETFEVLVRAASKIDITIGNSPCAEDAGPVPLSTLSRPCADEKRKAPRRANARGRTEPKQEAR